MKTDSSEFDDEYDDDNSDFNSEDSEFDHDIEDHFILIMLRWTQKSPGQGCLAEIFIYNPLHTKKTTHWKQINIKYYIYLLLFCIIYRCIYIYIYIEREREI